MPTRVSWGNLRRTRPFSSDFGFDRGTPIDRYYVLKFMERHRQRISGDVLEIQQTGYTRMFARNLRRSHSVDIDPQHGTTYVCDLAHSEGILASDTYDCFLMPNTLNHLRELELCLANALRVLKPGGVILATVATLVPLTPNFLDYWRLTPAGWKDVTARVWPQCSVGLQVYGNVLSTAAAMMGVASEELTPEELDVEDPRYPVLVGMLCEKPK
jgi:SAM-dependent methyltransferase